MPVLAKNLVCEEIRVAFDRYIQVYFRDRDREGTLACLDPGATGFGSGRDESVFAASVSELYRRDLEQCRAPIDAELRQIRVDALDRNCGVVSAEFDLDIEISGQPLRMNGLRMSSVFVRRDGLWRLAHMHFSMPWQPQREGEAFPLRELEERNRQLEAMVAERTEELRQALDEVKRLARIDSVTGLANRVALDENIAREIGYAQRYGTALSVILVDVDHFKRINDHHGHQKGDAVLRELAALIAQNVRGVDTVHRWGGEEFMILLPNTAIEHAAVCADYLRGVVETHDFGLDRTLTVSLGVAQMLADETREDWIRRTDQALYRAKASGRNRVEKVV